MKKKYSYSSYDENKNKLVESYGEYWIKVMYNSTWVSYSYRYFENTINEKRSDKLKKILSKI
jgi:hypothetical protein